MDNVINFLVFNIEKNKLIDELTHKKIRYGLEVIIINLFKFIIALGISLVFNIFFEFIIFSISMSMIRKYSFGVHAKYFTQCIFVTNISIFSCIYISKNMNLSNIGLAILFIIILAILFKYAPADTEKRPLKSKLKRKRLRIKAIRTAIILYLISLCFSNYEIKNLILMGMFLAAMFTTPLIYKLLGVRYKNYEKYS